MEREIARQSRRADEGMRRDRLEHPRPDLCAEELLSEDSFSWHATFPPGTFVPPHIHPDAGRIHLHARRPLDACSTAREDSRDGRRPDPPAARHPARPVQQIRADREVPVLGDAHGRLYDLFWAIHGMKEQNPDAWWRSPRSTKWISCPRLREHVIFWGHSPPEAQRNPGAGVRRDPPDCDTLHPG